MVFTINGGHDLIHIIINSFRLKSNHSHAGIQDQPMYKFIISVILLTQINIVWATQNLVTTKWLAKNLNNQKIVLIDMSDSLQYQRFHIPGAIHLPYQYLNQSKQRVSLSIGAKNIIKLLGQTGISQDSHVVAYDDTGGLHASRLLWELEQLNHPKMSLLDGGLVKWIREGRKISFQAPLPKATKYTAKSISSSRTAKIKDVAPATRDQNTILLDVRSPEEYRGHPKQPRSGHVPGALFWQWDQALNIEKGFVLQDSASLKKEMKQFGLTDPEQPVIVYCRSGHRASHTFFTLRQLGFKNVKLYDGSMKEYEKVKTLPLTKGMKP